MHYLTANENTGALTMTSREIAEVVGSRHDKVKQSIERLADRGVIQLPPVGEVKNRQGQTVFEYLVSKRDSYVVVAQLSPPSWLTAGRNLNQAISQPFQILQIPLLPPERGLTR